MAARGVVSLKFIVDFSRRAQLLFQIVGADQGRGTVELVKFLDFLWNRDIAVGAVQLLLCQLVAEDGTQVLDSDGLHGGGVEQWIVLFLQVSP